MPRLWEQLQLGLGALSGRLEGPRWWKPFLERLYGEQLFLKKALQHAVRLGSPDSLGILWDDVRQGTGSRGEALRWAIENFPQQDEELKHLRRTPQQVAAICRSLRELVGAAYLAVLAKTFDPKSLGLLQRLTPMVCATWKETPPTAGSNVSPSWPREDLSDLLPEAVCDAYLKALRQLNPDVWHVASVRNDVWGLLETDRPVIRRRWMPVVYVDDPKPGRPSDQPQDKGYVAQLHVELLADGTQECFVDRLRMTLVPIDEDFASAIQTAWHVASSMVPGIDGVDVRWWLQGEGGQFKGLNGGSLGAAMGVSLVQLLSDQPLDQECAITAQINEDSTLGKVDGVFDKAKAAFDPERGRQIKRIIVHPSNRNDAIAGAEVSGLAPEQAREAVQTAETLDEACEKSSGLVKKLCDYFKRLAEAPDDASNQSAYMGDRSPRSVYVEPDVIKRERVARDERERPNSRRELELGPESREIGEDLLYGEREQETERRASWRQEWEHAPPGWRAVQLGPPGQGKTFCAQMVSAGLAGRSRQALLDQSASVVSHKWCNLCVSCGYHPLEGG